MGPEDEANRSPPRKKPYGSENQPPPVIIKLTDGKSTFKTMHIAERMRIQNEIISAVGEPRESTVVMGGDLAVVAHNKNNPADLMALKNILGSPLFPTQQRIRLQDRGNLWRPHHRNHRRNPGGTSRPKCHSRQAPTRSWESGNLVRNDHPHLLNQPTGESKNCSTLL
ncbi:hypothetical protein DAPPUDRAFT_247855 [Daphnia pulex]|uniref:Uncharacterized protein n=1 Tax=Daphnia pulex TaxID=6669 RepID=E9GT03_DAPPU|nr:hypothetical protein DAPPUDRAFT_247855 [Daphnia pulex]|eukprot:EFX77283.1 hypothetical protein DAPPUDRAFT_247855 [Daphnia pulex]